MVKLSIRAPISRISCTRWLYAITAGMAVNSPAAVVISASAMPGATTRKLAAPAVPSPEKASITPHTVPKSPMKGVTDPVVASQGHPARLRDQIAELARVQTNRQQRKNRFPPRKNRRAPKGCARLAKVSQKNYRSTRTIEGQRSTAIVADSSYSSDTSKYDTSS